MAPMTIASDRLACSPTSAVYVLSGFIPTVPVTKIMFPFRTAREYPIFGSHVDPVEAVRAPFRSPIVYTGNCDIIDSRRISLKKKDAFITPISQFNPRNIPASSANLNRSPEQRSPRPRVSLPEADPLG